MIHHRERHNRFQLFTTATSLWQLLSSLLPRLSLYLLLPLMLSDIFSQKRWDPADLVRVVNLVHCVHSCVPNSTAISQAVLLGLVSALLFCS